MTAFAHWTAMHAWWVARRTERDAIGRAWAPRSTIKIISPAEGVPRSPRHPGMDDGAAETSAGEITRRTALLARFNALPPETQTEFKALNIDKNDLDRIEETLAALETYDAHLLSDDDEQPTVLELAQQRMNADKARKIERREAEAAPNGPPPSAPDEGPEISMPDVAVATIRTRYNALSEAARAWVGSLVKQARLANVDFRLRDNATTRRYEIYRGVLALAEWGLEEQRDGPDMDEFVRSIVSNITGLYNPETPPGAALGMLNASQATQFAETVDGLVNDRFSLIYQADGTPQIVAA